MHEGKKWDDFSRNTLPVPHPGCTTSRAGHDGCSRGPASSWGSLHKEGDREGEKDPPTHTHLPPTTPPPRLERHSHGPLGPTHRVAAGGGGGIGDLGRRAAMSSRPLYPARTATIFPRPSGPPLTEFPLGLAHGPRTPGPLEETVGGPWGEAGWYTAPPRYALSPPTLLPRMPPNRPSAQQTLAGSAFIPHRPLGLSFPT